MYDHSLLPLYYLDEISANANDPKKVKQIIQQELERRIFDAVCWDFDRMLFIEENQE